MNTPTTRLAPSPTGALHLGNARTFLVNWAVARCNGHRIVLRIEDLDGPRVKSQADAMAIEDLRWLGMNWDEGPIYQRHDLTAYQGALDRLRHDRLIYPCSCTRSEIQLAQSAPHADEHELRYPGTCRPDSGVDSRESVQVTRSDSPATAWRLIVPADPISFTDVLHGPQTIIVQEQTGDFVVATKAGLPSYQLAVVVDDARQNITHVIRGDDLIRSTGRQLWLYRLLDLGSPPQYMHLPLVLGSDGRRLAKRHGDTRVAWYRQQGVKSERVIGLIARWCGLIDENAPLTVDQFLERFSPDRIGSHPVTLTAEDHAWLLTH